MMEYYYGHQFLSALITINLLLISANPCFSKLVNTSMAVDEAGWSPWTNITKSSQEFTNITLPDCMELTIPDSNFFMSPNGNLKLRTNDNILNIVNYNWTSHMTAANICYPLTPQLLNCRLTAHNATDYSVINYTFVQNGTDFKADLGDYYIDNDNGDTAFTCREPILIKIVPRCHYLVIDNNDYTIYKNGSFHIIDANFTVKRPSYTLDDTLAANICIPLRLKLFRCVLWILAPEDYRILPNKKIYHVEHQATFNLDQYFPYGSNDYVICAYDQPPPIPDYYRIYAIFNVISSACLAITVIMQLALVHMSCNAKSLLCFMLSMMFLYISQTARKWTPIQEINQTVCYTFFVTQYFFSMSAFFWLSVLSFDVWHHFTEMQTSPNQCRTCFHRKHQFIYYNVVSWGIPTILLIMSLIVDYNTDLQQALQLYPRISEQCWFNEVPSNWVFYYGPLLIIMIFNLICFIMTIVILRFACQGTEMVNKHKNKQLFFVCIKLFIIMGLCWILQVVCYMIESDKYWYIADAVTSLQGIAIFIVYIFNWSIYQQLLNKFFPKRTLQNVENYRKSLQHTISTTTVVSEISMSSDLDELDTSIHN